MFGLEILFKDVSVKVNFVIARYLLSRNALFDRVVKVEVNKNVSVECLRTFVLGRLTVAVEIFQQKDRRI